MERWVRQDPSALHPILGEVLPYFDSYLALVPETDDAEEKKGKQNRNAHHSGSSLLELQERITVLLGQVGGYNHALVQEASEVAAAGIQAPAT